ncbi:MAG: alpha/beta fold hydrolase [Bacteriovoracaceae bacterium]
MKAVIYSIFIGLLFLDPLLSHASSKNRSLSCQKHLLKLKENGYQYKWLSVPENYHEPQSRKIEVFYYWKIFHQESPLIAYFNGGPASSSHASFNLYLRKKPNGYNFVFIDQRGTGCSSLYPEMKEENIARYQYYFHESIVRDAERIRESLLKKSQKWIIFGQSFGSKIVHQYISLFPHSIRAAFAHGAVPEENNDPFKSVVSKSLNQIKMNKKYFQKHSDDKNGIKLIRAKVRHNNPQEPYCISRDDVKLCGIESILATMGFFLGKTTNWDSIHQAIEKLSHLAKTNTSAFFKEFNRIFEKNAFDILEMNGPIEILMRVQAKKEGHYKTSMFDKRDSFKNELDQALLKTGRVHLDDLQLRSEATFEQGLESKLISKVETLELDPPSHRLTPRSVIEGLNNNPSLDFYLYASGLDTRTPPDKYEDMKKAGDGLLKFHLFPNGDHQDYHKQKKIWDDLDSIYFESI